MTDPDPVAAAVAALVAAIRSQVLAEVASAAPAPDAAQAEGPLLLTLPEARERLRVSKATLDRLMARGRIARVRIGARVFVPAEEIDRVMRG
ncbi:helix-turn-helix domain-containing protein [Mycobacteroides abscessus]|uniref:helix-turn-helix domain-containing protein n=1 Tax=Mycobacteroides abscessus TaxID=36809 RepID=UPI001878C4E6|nr:hypothetical protein [Mycobacteroides abscessus]